MINWWNFVLFVLILRFVIMIKSLKTNSAKLNRIAIVGGGFGGLATAWRFSKDRNTEVIHIYDRLQPGFADGSSNSAGIMHPIAPKGGKIIWNGIEGMKSSYELMNQVETKEYGKVYNDSITLNRVIYEKNDLADWKASAEINPTILEITDNDGINPNPSILAFATIKYSTIVNPIKYLKSLWHCVQLNCLNTEWKSKEILDLEDIRKDYDIVVLACGPGVLNLIPSLKKQIRLVRGQNLLYERFNDYDFNMGYLNGEYIIPHHSDLLSNNEYTGDYLICGATYEHITNEQYNNHFTEIGKTNASPNIQVAMELLNDKLHTLYPPLKMVHPIGATAGTRAVSQRSTTGRLPIVGKVPSYENVWLLTGFGSRGLLHHAVLSDYLYQAIVTNNPAQIPSELQSKIIG